MTSPSPDLDPPAVGVGSVTSAAEDLPPVQMSLEGPSTLRPVTVSLHLVGLTVVVDVWDGRVEAAARHLRFAGFSVRRDDRGLVFPVAQLPRMRPPSDLLTAHADGPAGPLWRLALHPPPAASVAVIDVTGTGALELAWDDGHVGRREALGDDAATALLASGLAFVATPEAWARLSRLATFPLSVGEASVAPDGYVEIATAHPGVLEEAPLPGLFRIDPRHYGVAFHYASHLDGIRGLTWAHPRPAPEQAPAVLQRVSVPMSEHLSSELGSVVARLAERHAVVLAWDHGLGRRVMALAAVTALDAWPALVVTPPSGLWLWRRHRALFALDEDQCQVVTYRALAAGAAVGAPPAIIVDDPFAVPDPARALHALDGVADSYRIATTVHWPDSTTAAVRMLACVRPGEFPAGDVPLAWRYPIDPARRAAEHVAVYLDRRHRPEGRPPAEAFRRTRARTVALTDAQRSALHGLGPADEAAAAGIVSAGTGSSVSPKVAAAVQIARRAAPATTAVWTRHDRTAALVTAAAADLIGAGVLRVVCADAPGTLAGDEVVVVDYPEDSEVMDAAVGPPSDAPAGPHVTLLHAPDSTDDLFAERLFS